MPIVAQDVGDRSGCDLAAASDSCSGNLRQVEVFDRVAERPMADVVQQRGGEQQLGVVRRDGCGEPLVGGQPIEVFDGRQEDAERMFVPRVIRGRIDEAHQAELAEFAPAGESSAYRSGAARAA